MLGMIEFGVTNSAEFSIRHYDRIVGSRRELTAGNQPRFWVLRGYGRTFRASVDAIVAVT